MCLNIVKIIGELLTQQGSSFNNKNKKGFKIMSCDGVNCANYCDGCNDLKYNNEAKEFTIQFEKIQDVKDFVVQSEKLANKIAMVSHNNYICDAKSLMGVFGLDLSQPVTITTTDEEDFSILFNFCKTRGIVT